MSPREGPEPARVFYAWWVALAFVVTVFLSTGIRFTVGLFLYGARTLPAPRPVAGGR